MYWDIVEVTPKPDFCLFVRFKDGLAGRVRVQESDLHGVLAPLRDARFFEGVFIDDGAVAWPGNIDLAPDAAHLKRRSALRSSSPAVSIWLNMPTFCLAS